MPPPPSGPPAGWYADPVDGDGYRWWDGSTWTDAVSSDQAPDLGVGFNPLGGPDHRSERIGPVDGLLSDTLRVSSARVGHLLPVIVLFVLSFGLASSIALWFGLRDTIVTFDETAAEPPIIDYGGSAPALWVYLALVPFSLLGGALLQAATARQVWSAKAGRPETWSASLSGVLRRWRPLLAGTAGKWLGYLVIAGGFVVLTVMSPAVVITFPFVLVALALLWLRLSFVGQAAVLAPDGVRPLSTSYRVTGTAAGKLFVRLLVLILVGLAVTLVVSLVGSVFTAIAGAEGGTPLDPDNLTYDLNAALGPNAALFALSGVFGSLALGGATVVVAAGTTLLYRNLDGPIDPDLFPADEVEPSAAIQPGDQTNDGPMLG